MTKYDQIPEHMQYDTRKYVEEHFPIGGFLYAVLSNDLVGAFGHADETNLKHMYDWANWLYNEAPSTCWGSREKVEAWLDGEPDDHY